MADNVISVIMRSVNEMSQDLQRINTDLDKLKGTTESAGQTFTKTSGATKLLSRDLLPLRSILVQITGVTGSFGTALFNLIRFGFSPLGIAITTVIASIAFLAKAWSDASKTAEELSKATDAVSQQLAIGNIEYRALVGVITEAEAAAQKFLRSQAKPLEEATEKVEKMRRSWGQFFLEFRGITGLGPSLADIFGLPTIKKTGEELEGLQQDVRSTGEQIKKTGETAPVVAFTKSLKEQIIQLETQRREMTLGADAAFEYALSQKALTENLNIENFKKFTDEIMRRRDELVKLKFEQQRIDEFTKMWDTDLEALSDPLKNNTELLEWNKKRAEELGEGQKSLTDIILDGVELRKEGLEREIFQIARWESEQIEALEKLKEKYPELAASINESLASINEQALQKTTDAIKKSQKEAEEAAANLAKSFTDRFITMMEGEKADILGFFRDLGRAMVSEMLQEMLAAALLGPVTEQIQGGKRPRTTAGLFLGGAQSLLNLIGLGGIFGASKPIYGPGPGQIPEYGKGGILPGSFVPMAALRKFQKGGVARERTLGVIGEEGDEIVARMKPARQQDAGWQELRQNIYLVDDRRKVPPLGPRDVVMIIADDMNRGGDTAKTTQNVIKRL